MIHKVRLQIQKIKDIDLELDDDLAPKTVQTFLGCLPLDTKINVWGKELYTDETPINVGLENAKDLVDLMDVGYWPAGKAICLFFGPTPIGKEGEIRPYSPVNIIGRISKTSTDFMKNLHDETEVTFTLG